jgi:hypothetical protein
VYELNREANPRATQQKNDNEQKSTTKKNNYGPRRLRQDAVEITRGVRVSFLANER